MVRPNTPPEACKDTDICQSDLWKSGLPGRFVRDWSPAEKSRLPTAGDRVIERQGKMGLNDRHILTGKRSKLEVESWAEKERCGP